MQKSNSKKEMIFNNKKNSSFINGKIVDYDDNVTNRMAVLDRLMGNYGEATEIKENFLKMIVMNTSGKR